MSNDSEYYDVPGAIYDGLDAENAGGMPGMDHSKMDHGSMDHGSMNHGGGHGGHSMAMNFHGNHAGVVFLFEQLVIETTAHLGIYTAITFFLGVFVEFLKHYRLKKTNARLHATASNYQTIHLFDTVLHLIQTTLGYFLMLIAMTFHYLLFSAAMLGMAAGFWYFNRVPNPDELDAERAANDSKHALLSQQLRSTTVTGDSCGCS